MVYVQKSKFEPLILLDVKPFSSYPFIETLSLNLLDIFVMIFPLIDGAPFLGWNVYGYYEVLIGFTSPLFDYEYAIGLRLPSY